MAMAGEHQCCGSGTAGLWPAYWRNNGGLEVRTGLHCFGGAGLLERAGA